jgi:Zn-dependent protease with chaperone function
MNFFAHQEQARRRTGQLVFYYGLSVALIVVIIYLVLGFAFGWFLVPDESRFEIVWNPDYFLGTAAGVLGVIGLGTMFQILRLSSGGASVAEMLGGRLIPVETRDPLERRFLNIVEEMALASGVPVPKAYVMDEEKGINAFAAGYKTTDAVVAVTRGCLETLTRDELQGVIAHEFSHILNGDMRINIRLIGVLYGILLVSMIGYGMFRVAGMFGGERRSRDSKNNGGAAALAILLAGLAIWLIGYIGVFFANLIKSAVSREREYLADASAVQFTRNPDGLGGALKKIGALSFGSKLQAPRAAEVSHLFFSAGVNQWFSLMATHPPLEERIRRIDPRFDGDFKKVRLDRAAVMAEKSARPAGVSAFAGPSAVAAGSVSMASLSENVGTQGSDYLAFVQRFMEQMPPPLHEALRDTQDARAVAFALLLDKDAGLRRKQLALVQERCGEACRRLTETLAPVVAGMPRNGRLPLGDLAMGALRQLPKEDYTAFRDAVMGLAGADDQVDLFEYAFLRMMVRRLDAAFGRGRKPGGLIARLSDAQAECAVLLGALARFGAFDENSARQAFAKSYGVLFPNGTGTLPVAGQCQLKDVDGALGRLADLRPALKEKVLDACGLCAGHDGQVTVQEADLLRAVADALECPVPPLSLKAG